MTIEERIDEIRNAIEPASIKPEELADILDLLNKGKQTCEIFPIAGTAICDYSVNPPAPPQDSTGSVPIKGVVWKDGNRAGFSAVVFVGRTGTFEVWIDFKKFIADASFIHQNMYGINSGIVSVDGRDSGFGLSVQLPQSTPDVRIYPIFWADGWLGFRVHTVPGAPSWSITADWIHNVPEVPEEE